MRLFLGRKILFFLTLMAGALLLTGVSCVQIKTGGGTDGGVFKSIDQGENWQQKAAVPTISRTPESIGRVNVSSIEVDPQDNKALYLATAENGMFYTYDGGENWFKTKEPIAGQINAVAVSPRAKCIIFVALANKILKSTDCSRSWQTVYFDTRPEVFITSLAVNHYNSDVLYAGVSSGELLKSADAGKSWVSVKGFTDSVAHVLIDARDSRIIYVATQKKGIFKTKDSGASWVDLNEGLKEFSGSQNFRGLVQDAAESDTLVLASKYGLLKTVDAGETWNPINLLTPPGAVDIYSLAINPQNGQEIYYGTATTFYKSSDGGKRWRTKKLPTSRAASALLVDPENSNIIYMGVKTIKKKR